MAVFELTPEIGLEFCPLRGDAYKPIILKDGDFITLPLVVVEDEIESILERLKAIDFSGHPLNYIKMMVSGCIAIVLKTSKVSEITF